MNRVCRLRFAPLFLAAALAACASPEEFDPGALEDEAVRREIFVRWTDALLRAESEVGAAPDIDGGETSLQASAVYDVYDRYLSEVASEFGIPEVEVLAIQVEGLRKGWPRPEQER